MSPENNTIFGRILKGEIKAEVVFESDTVLAFKDLNPQAPTHILLIPKKHIDRLSSAEESDKVLLGELLLAVRQVALQLNIRDYRVVINNGEGAGQSVFHLHAHLLAGRPFAWPPG